MTAEQIERRVELRTDRIDARFMAEGSTMTQAEYDAEMSALDKWAQQQYDAIASAPFKFSRAEV